MPKPAASRSTGSCWAWTLSCSESALVYTCVMKNRHVQTFPTVLPADALGYRLRSIHLGLYLRPVEHHVQTCCFAQYWQLLACTFSCSESTLVYTRVISNRHVKSLPQYCQLMVGLSAALHPPCSLFPVSFFSPSFSSPLLGLG